MELILAGANSAVVALVGFLVWYTTRGRVEELRDEIRNGQASLTGEMRGGFSNLQEEIRSVRSDITALRSDLTAVALSTRHEPEAR